jgi:cyclase
MPLAFRLIARIDIKGPDLIKTVQLEGVKKLGNPAEYAKRYNDAGIDEIYYNDAVASLYGRNSLADLVSGATDSVFCPVVVGGGITSVGDVRKLLLAGADKIAINTAAIKRPELITEVAEKFGSQCMVVQIDAKRKNGGWEAYCDGGREPTGRDAIKWGIEATGNGAGEILLTSIDDEGVGAGPDLVLCQQWCGRVRQPVIYSGGVVTAEQAVAVARAGMSGVAMAGALHYNKVSLPEIRAGLKKAGVSVREM